MWADGLDYNEPSNASTFLQAWFREAVETFPPLNGRLRPADITSNEWTADYAIGGPAERAGLEEGDLLLELDGEAITGVDRLHRLLTAERAGREVAIRLLRRGKPHSVTLTPEAD